MDLLATDRVSPQSRVEMYYVKYNGAQRWYWLPRQTVRELLVFTNFDSEQKATGPCMGTSNLFLNVYEFFMLMRQARVSAYCVH